MLLKSVIFLVAALLITMFVKGWWSHKGSAPGLHNGQLAECPDTPNCINSESYSPETRADAKVDPVPLPDKPLSELQLDIINTLDRMGAGNPEWQGHYLATRFTSLIFRFVDDFELRIDESEGLLHIRSASRVGKSDFSVNRKRYDAFRAHLTEAGW
ncbi:DUF1499 domain-containing protein [Aliamphritea hakodatensis]|uniref:DUF1499 domain-containing protein n=1 Tax=Aliamphritea hakodatensis TaxID=2895352 RepID=UPI0022FD7EE8|nr:DUF1499 domain-containing protein [Aliamphritea hakodatensis]